LLSELVMNRIVMIVLVDADRYGRLVGRIYVGTTDVSAQLVAEGAAWFNSEFAHDESLYLLEGEARNAKRGLCALAADERIEPWEFRKRRGGPRWPAAGSMLRVEKAYQRVRNFQNDAVASRSASPGRTLRIVKAFQRARILWRVATLSRREPISTR
jgi:hypothetical protein